MSDNISIRTDTAQRSLHRRIQKLMRENSRLSQELKERERLDEALRESEMKFRGAFEYAAIGYALQTPEGAFVEANPAYCNLVGYSMDELHQLKFFQLLHPEDCDKHMQVVKQLLEGEIPNFVIESRYLHKNGNIVWIRKSCSLLTDVHGEPKHMISLIEDITEHKQAEESKIQLQVQQEPMEQREQERLLISQDIHDGPIQTLTATTFELEMARQQFHNSAVYPQLIEIG